MTNPPPTASIRLPLPTDRPVYTQLSTDFYPWTEVLTDLERRQDPEFSAVMDVQQDDRWARFVWVRGAARGGVGAGGRDVTLEAAMRGLPRAQVSLVNVDPLVAEIVWTCRTNTPRVLGNTWPAAFDELNRERFYGALLSGPNCSYWESGRVVTGALPQSGVPCVVVSPVSRLDRETFIMFWQELIALTQRANPAFSEAWRQVSMQLSAEHLVLDPFAHEVTVSGGQLRVERDVSLRELRPALLAAYQASLVRLGMRLADLPTANLRQHEVWVASGLETI